DLLGLSDTHHVARTIARQKRSDFASHFAGQGMRFANSKSSDGKSWKIQLNDLLCTFAPKIGERRSLHDPELPLREFTVSARLFQKIFSRTRSPFRRARDGGFCFVAWRGGLNALIEHHRNVRAERELNLCRFFRREHVFRAVQMRTKTHTLIRDL